ncbi:2503_t:CDS:2, partial [Funneliformis geosporum]
INETLTNYGGVFSPPSKSTSSGSYSPDGQMVIIINAFNYYVTKFMGNACD